MTDQTASAEPTVLAAPDADRAPSVGELRERLDKARRARLRLQADHRAETTRLGAVRQRAATLQDDPTVETAPGVDAETPAAVVTTGHRKPGWWASLWKRVVGACKRAFSGGDGANHASAAHTAGETAAEAAEAVAGEGTAAPKVKGAGKSDPSPSPEWQELMAEVKAIEARLDRLAEEIRGLDAEIAALEAALVAAGETVSEPSEGTKAHVSMEGQEVPVLGAETTPPPSETTGAEGITPGERTLTEGEQRMEEDVKKVVARYLAGELGQSTAELRLSGDYARAVCMDPDNYRVTEVGAVVENGEVLPVFRLEAVRHPDTGEWQEAPVFAPAVGEDEAQAAPAAGRGGRGR